MGRDLLLLLALKDDTELRKANQQNTKENSTAHTLMRKKKTCCRICCRGKKHPKKSWLSRNGHKRRTVPGGVSTAAAVVEK